MEGESGDSRLSAGECAAALPLFTV